jgi:predicted ArsR family transcriptional regulator
MPYAQRPGRSRSVARRERISGDERRRMVLATVSSVRLSAYEVAQSMDITIGYAATLLANLECEGLVRAEWVGRRRLWRTV